MDIDYQRLKVALREVLREEMGFGRYAIVPPDLDLETWGSMAPHRRPTGDEGK